jgi:hypothetical protein
MRMEAGRALWRIRGLAEDALPAIEVGLRSKDNTFREFAARLAAEVGPAAAPFLPLLRDKLRSATGEERTALEEAVKAIEKGRK